jgi:hypothetical protein
MEHKTEKKKKKNKKMVHLNLITKYQERKLLQI